MSVLSIVARVYLGLFWRLTVCGAAEFVMDCRSALGFESGRNDDVVRASFPSHASGVTTADREGLFPLGTIILRCGSARHDTRRAP